MEEILKNLISIDGVISCFVIDREGEIIDFDGEEEIDIDFFSALIADIANEVKYRMEIPHNFSLLVFGGERKIFFSASQNFILALLADKSADTGEVRLGMNRGTTSLTKIL